MLNIKDEPLFKYINPDNNDLFNKLNSYDLQELLYYIDNYYLSLRTTLGLDKNDTFGTEIEFEDTILLAMSHYLIDGLRELKLQDTWRLKYDASLFNGGEISSPILTDDEVSWENLNNICYLIGQNADIGDNCGGHIHIGTQALGDNYESWYNFIKLWSTYENVIFRFIYGEYLTPRQNLETYAPPIAAILTNDYAELISKNETEIRNIAIKLGHARHQAINFLSASDLKNKKNKRNTIEFRCPNGTLDPIIWQNNINLLMKLLTYSKSSRYNDDVISKRQKLNGNQYNNLNLYNEIYLDQALELTDMIFTNNLDKIYFLRQYLKSFDIGTKKLEKAKPFTKTLKPKKPLS